MEASEGGPEESSDEVEGTQPPGVSAGSSWKWEGHSSFSENMIQRDLMLVKLQSHCAPTQTAAC